MKTLTFNKNSWHYWIVRQLTNYDLYSPGKQDICSYTRALFYGLLLISLVGSVSLIAFLFLASPILAFFINSKFLYSIVPTAYEIWFMIFFIGVLAGFCMSLKFLIEKIYYMATSKQNIKEPGPVKQMYNHWKEKTCVKVEFK